MAKLDGKLTALATMSPAELRDEWIRVHRTLPPRIAPDLLARGIAYRLQEKAHGELPVAVSKRLAAVSAGHPPIAADTASSIRPGARLVSTEFGCAGTAQSQPALFAGRDTHALRSGIAGH